MLTKTVVRRLIWPICNLQWRSSGWFSYSSQSSLTGVSYFQWSYLHILLVCSNPVRQVSRLFCANTLSHKRPIEPNTNIQDVPKIHFVKLWVNWSGLTLFALLKFLKLLTLLTRVDEQTPRDLGHGLLSGSDSTVVFLTQNNTKATQIKKYHNRVFPNGVGGEGVLCTSPHPDTIPPTRPLTYSIRCLIVTRLL